MKNNVILRLLLAFPCSCPAGGSNSMILRLIAEFEGGFFSPADSHSSLDLQVLYR